VVRALTPHIGAYLELAGGERLGVVRTRPVDDEVAAGRLRIDDDRVLLGCAEGALLLTEVRPAGKRAMAVADYLRGHPAPELAT
ncbi:MAG: methionyl-tRNA formyltransferase, partial [Actinomycetota bacterium]|nr:methionyl-tRNA formyltransferase [Actinomycetota bacterium]